MCRMHSPPLAQFDTDAVADLASKLGVRAMPTFFFIKNGTVVDKIQGANIAACVDLTPLASVSRVATSSSSSQLTSSCVNPTQD